MLQIRPGTERGRFDYGWLDTRHTFSFGEYYDPRHLGFRTLRVINDDRVVGGAGFPTHPHRDMEIVTYVLEGAIEHRDSLGTGSVIEAGDVQRMTAGTGVLHSEFNHHRDRLLRFLQIWIVPSARGLQPGYEQRRFSREEKLNRLRLVASSDGRDGSLTVHQDVRLYASVLDPGGEVVHENPPGRHVWLQVASGEIEVNGTPMAEGDGAATNDAGPLRIISRGPAEVLVFDLA